MPQVDTFSSLRLAHDASGGFFELCRNEEEVVCVGFDEGRNCVVELHIAHAEGPEAPDPEVFARHADAATRLRHPNLATVHDFGEDEGASYYVSEFVDGEELESYLSRCGELPAGLVARLLRDAAKGLAACADCTPVLAGLDLLQGKVFLSGSSVASLGVKICGFHFGNVRAEELPAVSVHRYYLSALCRMMVWAATGRHVSLRELEPETLRTAFTPEMLELLDALDGDRPAVATLEAGCALIEGAFDTVGGSGLERFPVPLLPVMPLEPVMFSRSQVGDDLAPEARLEDDPFDARTPYRLKTKSRSADQSGVVQVLPASDFLPSRITDRLLSALGKGNALDHPHLIRLLAYWPSENPGFFIEEEVGHVDLEEVVAWKQRLSPSEVLGILEQLEAASQQARSCGLTIVPCGAGQLRIHLIDSGIVMTDQTIRELAGAPLSEWPSFRLKVRSYPTFLSLARPATGLSGGDSRSEAMEFAWWGRRLLGNNEPPRVKSLLSDVLSGRAGAMIQTGGEFVQTFRSVIDPGEFAPLEGAPNVAGEDQQTVEPEPIHVRKGARQELNADAETDRAADTSEESEGSAPGFAEVLFSERADILLSEDPASDANEFEEQISEPYRPRVGNFLLTVLVVVIALLLAAIFAQLSGEAFWLK